MTTALSRTARERSAADVGPVRHRSNFASVQQGLGRSLVTVFGVLAILGIGTANPALTFCGCLLPPILFALLWRNGEPPVLLFACAFQWLQAFAPVVSADLEGLTLEELFDGPELTEAAWLSLIGVLVVAIGMHLAIRNFRGYRQEKISGIAHQLSRRKLFRAYLIGQVVAAAIVTVAPHLGGLRQVLLATVNLKWVPLFFLCWTTIQCRKPLGYMAIAVGLEIVIGFSGYFSGFKFVLFLLMIVIPGAASFRRNLPVASLSIVVCLTLGLVMFWQAVKVDYRNYLNNGTGMQSVNMSIAKRLQYLAMAATSIKLDSLHKGLISGVNRLGYIHYFAYSIRNVPSSVPHQNGGLWIGAIQHTLMPRILFPNKPVIDASARTQEYTGLYTPGRDRGTSISIGFIGESYIDFGRFWMFAPLLILGFVFGSVYRYFASMRAAPLLGMAMATTVLMIYALHIELSNIGLVGGLVMAIGVMEILRRNFGRSFMTSISRARTATSAAANRRRQTISKAA
jgi:hypothetical protein